MSTEPIGIIGAMREEVERFLCELEEPVAETKAKVTFYRGRWCGRPVVVCRSGVGKVNAAVCTQMLIDRFGVGAVVFTGVAGALDPRLDIGDIVVSEDCMHHDMDVSPLGFPRGVIPFADVSVFPADKRLVELALEAGRSLAGRRVVVGRVLSGDRFVADRETVRALRDEFGGACTEMEGAATAQVCHLNGVPYVVIRSMSDRADGSAHVDFATFTGVAAENSFRLVREMVSKI